jgi:outer membrane protein OmpA-like peptidoglycan-associated protein
MKILRQITPILLIIATSCSGITASGRLNAKKNEIEKREDFNGYLAGKYLSYSNYKSEINEWNDANYFAKKGLKASKNKEVLPEDPMEWKTKFVLKNINMNELVFARNDLTAILNKEKAKEKYPMETANLQFLYDCWISEESVYEKYDQVSKCKVKFFVLKDYLDEALKEKKIEKAKEDEYLITKNQIKEGIEYNIYFDFDSYKLNRKANQEILTILNFLQKIDGDYKLTLEGHTDRVGKKLYNDSLARKRVMTVKNKLTKNGIPNDIISVKSSGENKPKIITKNEQREKLNRRVTIKVEEFNKDFSPVPLPLK